MHSVQRGVQGEDAASFFVFVSSGRPYIRCARTRQPQRLLWLLLNFLPNSFLGRFLAQAEEIRVRSVASNPNLNSQMIRERKWKAKDADDESRQRHLKILES
jgi:hypothetical protein